MQAYLTTESARNNALSKPWADHEDKALQNMRVNLKFSYAEIARRLPGRTKSAIMHRISRLGLVDDATSERYAVGWREYEDAILKESLGQNLSYAVIAKKLNRTRNACIGRANRLGLIVPGAKRHEPLPGLAGMEMPKRSTCAWPIGHPGEKGFHFCGGDTVAEKPYCDKHCHRAYTTYHEEITV